MCWFLASILSHPGIQVGASSGPSGLRPYAPQWGPVFETLPGPLLVTFLRALLRAPSGGAATAAIFAPQLLQALARLILDAEVGLEVGDAALLLLAELCELVKPLVTFSSSVICTTPFPFQGQKTSLV